MHLGGICVDTFDTTSRPLRLNLGFIMRVSFGGTGASLTVYDVVTVFYLPFATLYNSSRGRCVDDGDNFGGLMFGGLAGGRPKINDEETDATFLIGSFLVSPA